MDIRLKLSDYQSLLVSEVVMNNEYIEFIRVIDNNTNTRYAVIRKGKVEDGKKLDADDVITVKSTTAIEMLRRFDEDTIKRFTK